MYGKVKVGSFIITYLRYMQFNIDKYTIDLIPKYFCIFSLLHVITIGMWGHFIHYFNTLEGESFSFNAISYDVAGILSSYVSLSFQVIYIIYNKDIRAILTELGNFTEYEMPANFPQEMIRLNRGTKMLIQLTYMSQFLVLIVTIASKCETGDQSDCGLLITAYLPFDIFYTPMRQIFAFFQCTSGYHSAVATMCIAMAFVVMMHCLVLQTKQLQVMLLKIRVMQSRHDRKRQVKKCVLYHYRILALRAECSKHSERLMFVLVFMASVITSLTSYQLIALEVKMITAIHMFAYYSCCLTICMFGEKLIQEGENLFFTLYDAVPWDGDVSTAKDLYIMMMMARNELYLPAGKFGPIGHIRALLLVKGTYSFLTLFLNI